MTTTRSFNEMVGEEAWLEWVQREWIWKSTKGIQQTKKWLFKQTKQHWVRTMQACGIFAWGYSHSPQSCPLQVVAQAWGTRP